MAIRAWNDTHHAYVLGIMSGNLFQGKIRSQFLDYRRPAVFGVYNEGFSS